VMILIYFPVGEITLTPGLNRIFSLKKEVQ